MTMQIFDCEQGSEEWFAHRLGLPTASEFHTVMARGKDGGPSVTRKIYMLKLAGELLTGQPMESYSNAAMDRGKAFEDEAREAYAFTTSAPLRRVGFIRNGCAGCSPDALIGGDSGLEIKVAAPHIQIERLLKDELPTEHRAQVQGNIFISDRASWDFVSYCPGLPLFVKHCPRDDGYIATIAGALTLFGQELAAVVERISNYGKSPLMQRLEASVRLTGKNPRDITNAAGLA
jgi:hypothetical protein